MNVDTAELNIAAQFLYCQIGEVQFNFHAIPVGTNPRLSSKWHLMIRKLRDRLSTWRSR